MKSKLRLIFNSCFIFLFLFVSGESINKSKGGRNRISDEQRDIIHYLASHHDEFNRKVTITNDGYEAITTTDNAELVKKLHSHFKYMKSRMERKAIVRRWDPAFIELADYYDKLEVEIEFLDNGLKVIVTGRTQEAARVAQNHAKIVNEFIKEGLPAVEKPHKKALE